MTRHHFHLTVQWPGGRNSVGTIQCGRLETKVSIDPGMGGPGIGTNPDEMLLGAAGTCYFMTLAAMIERAGLAVETMSLESDMTINGTATGFVCEKIVHSPAVTLSRGASTKDIAMLEKIAVAAEQHCMVSNAMRGNVEITVEPILDQRSG